jgi:hypothetical protein
VAVELPNGKTSTAPVYKGGVLSANTRNTETLVITSTASVANAVDQEVYAENDDVIKGQGALTTLDTRTSKVCIARTGAAWDMEGRPLPESTRQEPFPGPPPWHPRCRSKLYPITFTWEELVERETGKRAKILNTVPDSVRASMDGEVANNIRSFDDWYEVKGDEFARNALGPAVFDLWKAGTIATADLVDRAGQALTVDELEALADGRTDVGTIPLTKPVVPDDEEDIAQPTEAEVREAKEREAEALRKEAEAKEREAEELARADAARKEAEEAARLEAEELEAARKAQQEAEEALRAAEERAAKAKADREAAAAEAERAKQRPSKLVHQFTPATLAQQSRINKWFASEVGLTARESVSQWMNNGFDGVSKLLRGQDYRDNYLEQEFDELKRFVEDLDKAFELAPKSKALVFRGVSDLPPELLEQWRTAGTTLTFDSFTSWSRDSQVATSFTTTGESNSILLRVETQKGLDVGVADLGPLTFMEEKEVLLDRGSRFEVVSSREVLDPESGELLYEITLKELEPAEKKAVVDPLDTSASPVEKLDPTEAFDRGIRAAHTLTSAKNTAKANASLTESEQDALGAWQDASSNISSHLRLGTKLKEADARVLAGLESAFKKAKVLQEADVFRGMSGLKAEDFEAFTTLGNTVNMKSFTSWSRDIGQAVDFAKPVVVGPESAVVFRARNKGIDIGKANDPFSRYAIEDELIVNRNTTYRVAGVRQVPMFDDPEVSDKDAVTRLLHASEVAELWSVKAGQREAGFSSADERYLLIDTLARGDYQSAAETVQQLMRGIQAVTDSKEAKKFLKSGDAENDPFTGEGGKDEDFLPLLNTLRSLAGQKVPKGFEPLESKGAYTEVLLEVVDAAELKRSEEAEAKRKADEAAKAAPVQQPQPEAQQTQPLRSYELWSPQRVADIPVLTESMSIPANVELNTTSDALEALNESFSTTYEDVFPPLEQEFKLRNVIDFQAYMSAKFMIPVERIASLVPAHLRFKDDFPVDKILHGKEGGLLEELQRLLDGAREAVMAGAPPPSAITFVYQPDEGFAATMRMDTGELTVNLATRFKNLESLSSRHNLANNMKHTMIHELGHAMRGAALGESLTKGNGEATPTAMPDTYQYDVKTSKYWAAERVEWYRTMVEAAGANGTKSLDNFVKEETGGYFSTVESYLDYVKSNRTAYNGEYTTTALRQAGRGLDMIRLTTAMRAQGWFPSNYSTVDIEEFAAEAFLFNNPSSKGSLKDKTSATALRAMRAGLEFAGIKMRTDLTPQQVNEWYKYTPTPHKALHAGYVPNFGQDKQ